MNEEASTVRLPGQNVAKPIPFNLSQHSVKLRRKGSGNSTSVSVIFLNRKVVFILIVRMIVVIMDNEVTIVLLGRLSWLLGLATTLGAGLASICTCFRCEEGSRDSSWHRYLLQREGGQHVLPRRVHT